MSFGALKASPSTFLLIRPSLQVGHAVDHIVYNVVGNGLRFLSFHFHSRIMGIKVANVKPVEVVVQWAVPRSH